MMKKLKSIWQSIVNFWKPILLIIILIGGGTGAYIGGSAFFTSSLTSALQQPYSYLIYPTTLSNGTVLYSAQNSAGQVVNGWTSTDNSVLTQNVQNSLTKGGSIKFASGNFSFPEVVNITNSYISVYGDGVANEVLTGAATLLYATGTNAIFNVTCASSFQMTDIAMKGSVSNDCVQINSCIRAVFTRTTFAYAAIGVELRGQTYTNQFMDCPFQWCDTGIKLNQGAGGLVSDTQIEKCNFKGCTSISIYDNASAFTFIDDCEIVGEIGLGTTAGIYITGAKYLTIKGNSIREMAGDGIRMEGLPSLSSNALISSNMIYHNNYGIRMNSANNGVHNTLITSNDIWNNVNDGIYIYAGAYNTTIKGNKMQSNGGLSITDLGTASKISDPTMNPVNLGNLGVIGDPVTVVVKEAVSAGDLLFRNSTGVFKASATSTATMLVYAMAIETASINTNCLVITNGHFRNDAWTAMTVGATQYAATTFGGITPTAPSSSGNGVQDIGKAETSKILDFYNNGGWGFLS